MLMAGKGTKIADTVAKASSARPLLEIVRDTLYGSVALSANDIDANDNRGINFGMAIDAVVVVSKHLIPDIRKHDQEYLRPAFVFPASGS